MSLDSRLQDAETFWQEGRKEKALLAVLSAVNDTARKRFPQAKDNAEAMAYFIADAAAQLTGENADLFDWGFRGGISLGEVLHDVYRGLLQTGKMPDDVELRPGEAWQVHLLEGNRRGYSDCLIPRLIEVVRRSPENAGEFPKRK